MLIYNTLRQNKNNKKIQLKIVTIIFKFLYVAYRKSVSNMHKKIAFIFKFQRIANRIRDFPVLKTNYNLISILFILFYLEQDSMHVRTVTRHLLWLLFVLFLLSVQTNKTLNFQLFFSVF
jgi:hypothetical protein